MKAIFASAKAKAIVKNENGDPNGDQQQKPIVSLQKFTFGFDLGDTGDKKKKRKKKKKSKSAANADSKDSDGEDDEEMENGTTDNQCKIDESFSEYDSNTVKDLTKLMDDTPLKPKQQNNVGKAGDAQKSVPSATVTNTVATTTTTPVNVTNKNKKKSKSKVSKSGSNNSTSAAVADIDDSEFDALINQMQELNAKEAQNAPKKTKNSSNTKSSTVKAAKDSVYFLSPKDPELDESSKMRAKYGNGKNLVAIGPKKYRDPNWIGGLNSHNSSSGSGVGGSVTRPGSGTVGAVINRQPAVGESSSSSSAVSPAMAAFVNNSSVNSKTKRAATATEEEPIVMHSSAFSFSFGGL